MRLFAAAEALREATGVALWPTRRNLYDQVLDRVRVRLDEAGFASARADGRAMTLEQAVAYALQPDDAPAR